MKLFFLLASVLLAQLISATVVRLRVSVCESRYRNAFLTLAEPDRLPRQKWFSFFHSSLLEEASQSSHFRRGAPLLDSASANIVSFALE
ncbi:MAG: hypothetical protein LAN36_15585, partial [Acidobacteriia bacterium]|nr:hypothetical protein [Terriglobia bacterium]